MPSDRKSRRRCGHCKGEGHDKRQCPVLVSANGSSQNQQNGGNGEGRAGGQEGSPRTSVFMPQAAHALAESEHSIANANAFEAALLSNSAASAAIVAVMRCGGGGGGRPGGRKTVKCGHCREYGHNKRRCPVLKGGAAAANSAMEDNRKRVLASIERISLGSSSGAAGAAVTNTAATAPPPDSGGEGDGDDGGEGGGEGSGEGAGGVEGGGEVADSDSSSSDDDASMAALLNQGRQAADGLVDAL